MNKLDFAYRSLGICEEVCREKQAEIDALKAQNAELISAFSEVLRISDRQHDAWDAAKAAIAKARGDL